jgi:hypothetical protein
MTRLLTAWLRRQGGTPVFRIYGKGRSEPDWRTIDIFATYRRDSDSRWPLWSGTCITWTDEVIVVGWDFASMILCEQRAEPASREHPVEVAGGRLHDWPRRAAAGASSQCSASEVLAHECGHTAQVRRLGPAYLPLVGAVTLFREGEHWWNHFENDASAQGMFGGIVTASVSAELLERVEKG